MAYDVQNEIDVIRKGQAAALPMPIPPGVAGYSPTYRSGVLHDIAAANRLLDRVGYRKDADGYRSTPDGKPLVVRFSSQTDATARDYDELWKKAFDAIGIRLTIEKGRYSDQIKAAIGCQHQLWSYGWIADYPDGDNFMQLLYGKNIHQSNNACASIPEYDKLYEQSLRMPDSPARNKLYVEMAKVMEAYAPWRLDISRYRNMLAQPWVLGYRKHPILHAEWQYIDVAPERK